MPDLSSRSILDDLEAGEQPLSLNVARRDPRLCIDGRVHDISWIHRATGRGCRAASGERVQLESTILSGRKITTRSAIARFIARQAAPTAPTTSPAKAHADAVRRLAAVL